MIHEKLVSNEIHLKQRAVGMPIEDDMFPFYIQRNN